MTQQENRDQKKRGPTTSTPPPSSLSHRNGNVAIRSRASHPKPSLPLAQMAENEICEPGAPPQYISITPLLKRLWPSPGENNVTVDEIAQAVDHIFTGQLSPVQTGALLTCLHFTGWDRRADIIAHCAKVMRDFASPIDKADLERVVKARGRPEGAYHGGLVRIR